jgi:hypothetical protein
MANPIKKPQLSDGTGVNLRSVVDYAKQAVTALNEAGEEDAAHFFDMFYEYLIKDVANGKPFGFTYKSLGL